MKLSPFLSTILVISNSFETMGFRRIASSTLLVALYVAEAHKAKRPINKNDIMVNLDLFYTSVDKGIQVLVNAGLAVTPKGEDNKQIFIQLTPKGEKFFEDIFDGKASSEPERPTTNKGMVARALEKNKKASAPMKEKPAPVVKEAPAPEGVKEAPTPKVAPTKPEAISSEPGPIGPDGEKGEEGIPAVTETKSSGLSPAAQAILDKKKGTPTPASSGKKKLTFGK